MLHKQGSTKKYTTRDVCIASNAVCTYSLIAKGVAYNNMLIKLKYINNFTHNLMKHRVFKLRIVNSRCLFGAERLST